MQWKKEQKKTKLKRKEKFKLLLVTMNPFFLMLYVCVLMWRKFNGIYMSRKLLLKLLCDDNYFDD